MTILSQIQEIHIGNITFHTYGLIIGLSISFAILYFINKIPENWKYSKFIIWLILFALIFGILGARISYFLIHISTRSLKLNELLKFWSGGTTIFGALIGGFCGYSIFWLLFIKNNYKIKFWEILDSVVPALALGQALGRIANSVNFELFGPPTQLPWAIPIPTYSRPEAYIDYDKFHPTFAYELILNFFNFLILNRISHSKTNFKGKPTAVYLISYGMIRLVVERFRIDTQPILGQFKIFDLLSIFFIVSGVTLSIINRKNEKKST